MSEKTKSLIFLAVSMVIFGTVGILKKGISLPSGTIAACRGLIGTLFLICIMLIGKKSFDAKAVKKNLLLLVFSGAAMGFNWILLFEAYSYTTVACATLCYYMAPTFVVLASAVVLGEKISLKKGICALLSLCGMVLISGILAKGGSFSGIRGIILGLCAAVLYASVILMNKKMSPISVYDRTCVQLAVSAAVLIPYTLLAEKIRTEQFDVKNIILLLVAGIIYTGVAYALYFGAMEKLPAQTVAVFSYVDPVIAVLASALILSEPFGIFEAVGTVLIIGSAVLSELGLKN